MSEAIVVALIAGLLSFAGSALTAFLTNRKSTALITYRLDIIEKKQDKLEQKQDKYNNVIERTFLLEKDRDFHEQRLSALEKKS